MIACLLAWICGCFLKEKIIDINFRWVTYDRSSNWGSFLAVTSRAKEKTLKISVPAVSIPGQWNLKLVSEVRGMSTSHSREAVPDERGIILCTTFVQGSALADLKKSLAAPSIGAT